MFALHRLLYFFHVCRRIQSNISTESSVSRGEREKTTTYIGIVYDLLHDVVHGGVSVLQGHLTGGQASEQRPVRLVTTVLFRRQSNLHSRWQGETSAQRETGAASERRARPVRDGRGQQEVGAASKRRV